MGTEIVKTEDRRTIRSKRDLANALFELLQEKNLDDITVQDITERALISKATFYNNFNDKSDLLTFLFRRCADDVLEKLEPFTTQKEQLSALDILYQAITIVVDFLMKAALPFKKMIANDKSRILYWSLTSTIESVLKLLIDRNELNIVVTKFDINIGIYYYAGAYANLIYKKLENGEKVEREKMISEIFKLSKVALE